MRPKLLTRDGVTLCAGRWARRLGVSRQRVYQLIQGDTLRFPGEPVPLGPQTAEEAERRRELGRRRRDRYRRARPEGKPKRCSACGEVGHNRRSCKRAPEGSRGTER